MHTITKGSIMGSFYFYSFLIIFIMFSVIVHSASKAKKHISKK